MENHIQSFHASSKREIRCEIVRMTSHLTTGQSGEIRRVPHRQFLNEKKKLVLEVLSYGVKFGYFVIIVCFLF